MRQIIQTRKKMTECVRSKSLKSEEKSWSNDGSVAVVMSGQLAVVYIIIIFNHGSQFVTVL